MGNFCYTALKYLLFFINILFVIAGLVLIAVGLFIRYTLNISGLNVFSYGLIFLGCITVLISFSGCCGAMSEVRCLLITYSIIMLLLALANIALTVAVFKYKDQLSIQVEEIINSTFNQESYQDPLHFIEKKMKCCGTTGPEIYNIPSALPPTCCSSSIDASLSTCTLAEAFPGCSKVVGAAVSYYATNTAYFMIVMTMFEFMTVLSAVYLCRYVNEKLIY